jgi:meso-butanediol dehydrogenase / (S,S)-butanediol dehydrogenase / diacetyl reductase
MPYTREQGLYDDAPYIRYNRLMDGKVAIVTGAGGGIGEAIALQLGRDGASVVVVDIDAGRGQAVADEIAREGGTALFAEADLRDVSSIEELVENAVDEYGGIDLLANNAGLTRPQQFFDVTPADWDAQHSLNARGAFFTMQAAARRMVERGGGRIVNLASIAALGFRQTTSVAYSASKGAVVTMTQVAAAQLAPHGITVNAVCPGPTYTEFVVREVRSVAGRPDLTDEQRQKLYASMDETVSIPIGRANTPEDVANIVVFLLSDRSLNVTGSAYVIDGGVMLR